MNGGRGIFEALIALACGQKSKSEALDFGASRIAPWIVAPFILRAVCGWAGSARDYRKVSADLSNNIGFTFGLYLKGRQREPPVLSTRRVKEKTQWDH